MYCVDVASVTSECQQHASTARRRSELTLALLNAIDSCSTSGHCKLRSPTVQRLSSLSHLSEMYVEKNRATAHNAIDRSRQHE